VERIAIEQGAVMMLKHQFGGPWTEEKLTRLTKYLSAYTTIFASNPKAATLKTIYVDAFAGTGYRSSSETEPLTLTLFEDEEAKAFQRGSATIALETVPSFDAYLFIDEAPEHVHELEALTQQFPDKVKQVSVIQEEANTFLARWCQETDWRTHRAVVFLDPYGMEVAWSTIAALAHTRAVDLWILFPLGQGVNRLLTRNHPPTGAWADRLTRVFGTDEWQESFYKPSVQGTLFESEGDLKKEADFQKIGAFFVSQLETVFAKVASNPLPLRNSKNVPIYLLCFASANPRGAPTAVKIASHILRA
jgi:three-Cys-motif partner protein